MFGLIFRTYLNLVKMSTQIDPDTFDEMIGSEVTYQKTTQTLSLIWSTEPTSISYIKTSEWINLNIDRIQKVINQQPNNLEKTGRFKSFEREIIYIIAEIKMFKSRPKWLIILESLFKMNILTIQTIEPLVLKGNSEEDIKFRQMMIYFIVLTNSLELTSNPCQSGEWSLKSFIQRVTWVRKHSDQIMKIFNLRRPNNYQEWLQ